MDTLLSVALEKPLAAWKRAADEVATDAGADAAYLRSTGKTPTPGARSLIRVAARSGLALVKVGKAAARLAETAGRNPIADVAEALRPYGVTVTAANAEQLIGKLSPRQPQ